LLGTIGELHPGKAIELELDGAVALAEFDLAAIAAAIPAITTFLGISPFPPIRQDIAVVVTNTVESAALLETAREAGGDLVADVGVFDVFSDSERLGVGRVSLAIHLTFQANDRTLTDEEIAEVRDGIVAALVDRHGAELRG
jgi:phenylalanyl-tRNA synthetase beta chain